MRILRHGTILLSAVAALGVGSAVHAQSVAVDVIVIPPSNVVEKGDGPQTVVVGSATTPAEFIGETCQAEVRGQNGESVHAGNDLLISTNGQVVQTIEDYEDEPFESTFQAFSITLGPTVTASLRFGQTSVVSSGGLTLTVDCPTTPPTVPPTVPTPPTTTGTGVVPPTPTTTEVQSFPPAQAATTTVATTGSLPATGSDGATWTALIAIAMLAAGGGLIMLARSPRNAKS